MEALWSGKRTGPGMLGALLICAGRQPFELPVVMATTRLIACQHAASQRVHIPRSKRSCRRQKESLSADLLARRPRQTAVAFHVPRAIIPAIGPVAAFIHVRECGSLQVINIPFFSEPSSCQRIPVYFPRYRAASQWERSVPWFPGRRVQREKGLSNVDILLNPPRSPP